MLFSSVYCGSQSITIVALLIHCFITCAFDFHLLITWCRHFVTQDYVTFLFYNSLVVQLCSSNTTSVTGNRSKPLRIDINVCIVTQSNSIYWTALLIRRKDTTDGTEYTYVCTRLATIFQDNLGKPAIEKVNEPFWILMQQEKMGWQWHHMDNMQII